MAACPLEARATAGGVGLAGPNCSEAMASMSTEIGGYYMYNLYDDCWYENDLLSLSDGHRRQRDPAAVSVISSQLSIICCLLTPAHSSEVSETG